MCTVFGEKKKKKFEVIKKITETFIFRAKYFFPIYGKNVTSMELHIDDITQNFGKKSQFSRHIWVLSGKLKLLPKNSMGTIWHTCNIILDRMDLYQCTVPFFKSFKLTSNSISPKIDGFLGNLGTHGNGISVREYLSLISI